jgi:hypothetical protein
VDEQAPNSFYQEALTSSRGLRNPPQNFSQSDCGVLSTTGHERR